jgi:hypothetical protein
MRAFCIHGYIKVIPLIMLSTWFVSNDEVAAILYGMNNWLYRALGWGVAIYAIMYLAWSGLVIYGYSLGMLSLVIRLAILFGITTLAARSLRLFDWKDILPYSVVWAVTAIVLDAIYLVPFTGWALYATWSVWLGYALIVVFPLIRPYLRTKTGNQHVA